MMVFMKPDLMQRIAKEASLSLNEPFTIKGLTAKFRFTDKGIEWNSNGTWVNASNAIYAQILSGEAMIEVLEVMIKDCANLQEYYERLIVKYTASTLYLTEYESDIILDYMSSRELTDEDREFVKSVGHIHLLMSEE